MPAPEPPDGPADRSRVAVGAQAVYDAVARAYDRRFHDELDGKPLDRALLTGLEAAGLAPTADLRRQPIPQVEYPSRRCYLLARRR